MTNRQMDDLTEFDRQLLQRLQAGVPLVREPYAQLASELACDEQSLLGRLEQLRAAGGVVREISGIFEAGLLGYDVALVALALDEDSLDKAGRLVAGHPGVSHCYGRQGRYNLWFTLGVSPQSTLGLDRTAAIIAEHCHAAGRMMMPALRRYKLHVRFGAASEDAPPDFAPAASRAATLQLTDEQILAIRALQIDLPNRSDPFALSAKAVGLDADVLLVHAAGLLAAGALRRYAAVLRHRRAGAAANVLVAWKVDEHLADLAGETCASIQAVSHCYLRPTAEDWPYNLYTMIHGQSRDDCEATIAKIANAAGLADRADLWTAHEYKKQRMRLFTEEEAKWEAVAQAGP